MQYGRLIDSALQSRSERYVAEILEQLRDVSVGLAHQQADRRQDDHERRVPDLARSGSRRSTLKVKSIAGRFDKLTFSIHGPWPPYNFVNIRLKLEA